MPKVTRTIIPRIRKSFRERGVVTTLCRSFLLPIHLVREHLAAKALRNENENVVSEFDRAHGVDTDGKFDGWTYLSDLNIQSANWIDGNDYAAIEPLRFQQLMTSFDFRFEDYTFIDFGSGKGRALLLASESPFKRILGLEFAPELHKAAEANIGLYKSDTQKCRDIASLNVDFADFSLPAEKAVLFFFHPCSVRVLSLVVEAIARSLRSHPRSLYLAYVAPTSEQERLFAAAGFLEKIVENNEFRFSVYRALTKP